LAVRIISGSLKGRKLVVPDILGLRPTPDRVRETVFNWLQADIAGSRCLDLFAGSGSLGLEAYSRGAASVTALEYNAKAFQLLQSKPQEWLLGDHFKPKKADAFAWLQRWSGEPYQIIFLDPPFEKQCLDEVLALILEKGCLDSNGLLYIERSAEQEMPSTCEVVKEQKAGMIIYGLYKFC
jgi:16S rRNA (guanine966-N2)-methyltransferase